MASLASLLFIGLGYAISSSCLVIINKWALLVWPYSSSLTFVQLTASWIVALILGKIGLVEVDALDLKKIKAFSPACLIFFVALACNMKLLAYANVDTFIVLRSLVPLATAFAERIAFKTPLPNNKAFATLFMIVIGSSGYVYADKGFNLTAYFWGFAYVVSMVVDTVLVKKVVTDVELTPWGLVLYNNIIASSLYPLFAFVTGELPQISQALDELTDTTSNAGMSVLVSCIFGISISYFGLNARKMLQATAFSVLGVVCKFGTVLVNTLLWEYHSSPIGIFWLCVCIAGGILYQRTMQSAVLTKQTKQPEQAEDIEKEPLDPSNADKPMEDLSPEQISKA